MSTNLEQMRPLEKAEAMPAPVWKRLRFEAAASAAEEPTLASLLNAAVLSHDHLKDALSYYLAQKLAGSEMNALQIREIFYDAYESDPNLEKAAERDMSAVLDRDPACRSFLQPFLFFKGTVLLRSTYFRKGLCQMDYLFQGTIPLMSDLST